MLNATAWALSALMMCSMIVGFAAIGPADAADAVHILPDGTVSPSDAPIHTDDHVLYTMTGDMDSPIVIERDGITLDGDGHLLTGTEYEEGVTLEDVSDVTLTGMDISGFRYGVYALRTTGIALTWNVVHGNVDDGVYLAECEGSTVSGNELADNEGAGLDGHLSHVNSVTDNLIARNGHCGAYLAWATNSTYSGNNLSGNGASGLIVDGMNNTVTDNVAYDNQYTGITVQYSENVTLVGNLAVTPLGTGIAILYSTAVSLDGNTASGSGTGLDITISSNCTLEGNAMSECDIGLSIQGDPLWTFMHDIDTSNTVDGRPVYYLIGLEDAVIGPDEAPDAGYLGVVGCSRVTVEGIDVAGNLHGILVAYTDNSTVANCTVSGNWHGIGLFRSANNTLVDNVAHMSGLRGMDIVSSPYAVLRRNNVTANPTGVYLTGSAFSQLQGNTVEGNEKGVHVHASARCSISGNRVTENGYGVLVQSSQNCTVVGNRVDKNNDGVRFSSAAGCEMHHNDFYSNTHHASGEAYGDIEVACDDGYPSGGNFYSDYYSPDVMSGTLQDQPGSDGIGDVQYVLFYEELVDRYPLMEAQCPYTPPTAAFAFAPETPEKDRTVTFNASSSYDTENPDRQLSFRWDWDGDGLWDTDWDSSPETTHQFDENGTYGVTLQVRNVDLVTDTCTVEVVVGGEPEDDGMPEEPDETDPWPLWMLVAVGGACVATVAAAVVLLLGRRPPKTT